MKGDEFLTFKSVVIKLNRQVTMIKKNHQLKTTYSITNIFSAVKYSMKYIGNTYTYLPTLARRSKRSIDHRQHRASVLSCGAVHFSLTFLPHLALLGGKTVPPTVYNGLLVSSLELTSHNAHLLPT